MDSLDAGYTTLATNIPEIYNLNVVPIPFDPKRFNEGDGIKKPSEKKKAKYHESYMLNFKITNSEKKRKSLCKMKADDTLRAKFTRSSQKVAEENAEDSRMREKESPLFVRNQQRLKTCEWPGRCLSTKKLQ